VRGDRSFIDHKDEKNDGTPYPAREIKTQKKKQRCIDNTTRIQMGRKSAKSGEEERECLASPLRLVWFDDEIPMTEPLLRREEVKKAALTRGKERLPLSFAHFGKRKEKGILTCDYGKWDPSSERREKGENGCKKRRSTQQLFSSAIEGRRFPSTVTKKFRTSCWPGGRTDGA